MTTIPPPWDRDVKPVFGNDATRLTLVGDQVTVARQSKRSQRLHGGEREVTFSAFDLAGIAHERSGKMIEPGHITFLFAHDPPEKRIESDQVRLRADPYTVIFTPVNAKRVDAVLARLVQLNPRIWISPGMGPAKADQPGESSSSSESEGCGPESIAVSPVQAPSDTEGPGSPHGVATDIGSDQDASELLQTFADLLASHIRARSGAATDFSSASRASETVDDTARKLAAAATKAQKGWSRMERKYTEEIRAALLQLNSSLEHEHSVIKAKDQVIEIDGDQVTLRKVTSASNAEPALSQHAFHIMELTDIEVGKLKPVSKWERFGENEYLRFVFGAKERSDESYDFLLQLVDQTTIFFGDARQHPEVVALRDPLAEYFRSRIHRPGTNEAVAANPGTAMSPPIEAAFPQEDVAEIRRPAEIADELRKLAELRNADVLSEEEFLRQKRRLLSL